MTTVPTTENLRRIKEAYSSGVLRVQYADRVVWYRSLTEMKEIIFSLEAQLYPKKSVAEINMMIFKFINQ